MHFTHGNITNGKLSMASNTRGEVDEVREERLRRLAFFHVRNIHVSFHSLTDPPRDTSTICATLKECNDNPQHVLRVR